MGKTARVVLEIYKAYNRGEMSVEDAVLLAKKAEKEGNLELLKELSYFIYSKASEREAYEFSRFLYSHGHESLIPLNHLFKLKEDKTNKSGEV